MKISLVGQPEGNLEELAASVRGLYQQGGHAVLDPAPPDVDAVFNLTSIDRPTAHYIRSDPSTFVATLVESPNSDAWSDRDELKKLTYGALVKTMSNVIVHRVHSGKDGGAAYFMTPELGFRTHSLERDLAQAIVDYVTPLAKAKMVIANRLDEDLPEQLHDGDEHSRELVRFGRKLSEMNLLPNVFRIDEILSERDLRLMMKIFGVKQLSYGNLSTRRDASTFWMSGRGVNKADLREVGKDLFLVKGYDPETQTILVSVPPGTSSTSRVSVDAIEHFKIYDALPAVGGILHVHAWMDGISATEQSWPCGSEQLADEVLELVLREPDPSRAVVGLKNHGLTITGPSLEEIFERVGDRLHQDIPALE